MHPTRFFIVFLSLCSLSIQLFGQSTAYFSFETVKAGNKILELKPTDMWFEVNGVELRDRSESYAIRVRQDSLDYVRICKRGKCKDALAHFIPGQYYAFRANACAGYELVPADRKLCKIGEVRFKIENGMDLSAEGQVGTGTVDSIYNEKPTPYYFAEASAMCQFREQFIALNEISKRGTYELGGFWFFFLQGEQLTVTWDYANAKFSIRVDGYRQKNDPILLTD